MSERSAALGHLVFAKETTPGVPVLTSGGIFVPYYKQSMFTDTGVTPIEPIFGNKFKTYESVLGHRSHKGSLEVLAEPNTAEVFADLLLTAGSITGSGPYTHPYTLGGDSNSYTMDISLVSQSVRFFGVKSDKLGLSWNKDEMRFSPSLSALGSWFGRQIASVSGSGPYTVTLDTTMDPSPTTGMVVGDNIQFGHTTAAPAVQATVASIVNGTQFTTTTNPTGMAAGDWVSLAPLTPSLALLQPFTWPNFQVCFGANAAAALTAAQTRLERGLTVEIMHDFESADGSDRSGGFDPASLIRTVGHYNFKIKKFFDTPADFEAWETLSKTAAVVRAYSQAQAYEWRFTMNDLRVKSNQAQTESGKVIYQEIEYIGNYSTGDGQGMDLKVLNGLAT